MINEDLNIGNNIVINYNSVVPSSINIITTDDENNQINKKMLLTKKELSTLKFIYDFIMVNKIPDCSVDSADYKSLMNKGLVKFSASYRNVILTSISENIFKSKKSSGSYSSETEDGNMEVKWKNF